MMDTLEIILIEVYTWSCGSTQEKRVIQFAVQGRFLGECDLELSLPFYRSYVGKERWGGYWDRGNGLRDKGKEAGSRVRVYGSTCYLIFLEHEEP